MTAAEVGRAVLASSALPTPGPVALELLELSRRVDVDVDDIVRVVASDPGVCARAMRVVNSAAHGTGRHVASVGDAVRLLGMRGITRVAIEVSVVGRHRNGLEEFDYGGFWADALARAAAAHVLARLTRRAPADEAFTYGLLSTVGRLALVSVYPDRYRELLKTLGNATAGELVEAELAVFEVDVESLSAAMMDRWGLPALHEGLGGDAAGTRTAAMLDVVRTAAHVAALMVATTVSRARLAETMQALQEFGVGAELAAEIFPEIVSGFRDSGASLAIVTPAVGTLAELYANAVDGPARGAGPRLVPTASTAAHRVTPRS